LGITGYPLKKVLLLVVCAMIASCDDFDDICAWGRQHLDFLRRFAEFHHCIACERWAAQARQPGRSDPVRALFCGLGGGRPHRLGLVRANKRKRSVKTRRKSASWDTKFSLETSCSK